jgi:hypothetical protein
MNQREHIEAKIDGIRLLHSEIVKTRTVPGLEDTVLKVIGDVLRTIEPELPKANVPKHLIPVEDSSFFLQAFRDTKRVDDGFSVFQLSKMINKRSPSVDDVLDFLVSLQGELRVKLGEEYMKEIESVSSCLYYETYNKSQECRIVLPMNFVSNDKVLLVIGKSIGE